ncbi:MULTISPECIES: acyl-CoA thioesterase [Pseudomonas]|uniref:Acyl-CoA thioesterase II n=1 Tax=Pseudomonas psychrophila TaxID=122355 RepID=A0ABY0VS26_9PSED|nr:MULTISPECIES: thioesterase family protein [Pseudomonas]EPJ92642.1 putative acyl-CoA thioesterase II [Pseudomonas psychrophila]KAB0489014.1 thioesterase family protein [Pseudomonas psychrophila]KMN02336.1 acyl-CoA thioesterase [Pseudomonas psychrophila]MDY7584426.1 thioesterase family protein [Pseudomonas sp. CCI3.1]MEB0069697.1 thioesterase family protein [Pseudomonas sp. CCI3.1]
MQFCELVAAVRNTPLNVTIPADWGQGRASFGGLVVALQYEAMRAHVSDERALRSLAVSFVGPVEADVPISFEVEVLREGRAVSQVVGRAVQKGQVVTLVQGSFGASRESAVSVDSVPAPEMKAPAECPLLPYIKGVTPEFMRHLSMAWAVGALPFTGRGTREMGGWIRLAGDVQDEPLTETHLLALVDAWPPALLPLLNKPTAGSTLTWTIEFVQPLPQASTLEWCKYLAVIEHARDGYGHVAANLWTPGGELIAISRQTVAVFG